MRNPLARLVARLTAPLHQRRFHRKFLEAFRDSDFCFVSSNCVGGRFSQLLDRPHASPTVGLWFEPGDYLRFVGRLEENLAAELSFDAALSQLRGYPMGVVNDVRIHFMHYTSEEEARAKWRRRAARIARDKVFLIFTDRDGATYDDLRQFDALPFARKLVFTHKAYPEFASAVLIPGYQNDGQVGDIYSDWHVLDKALSVEALQRLATGLPVNPGGAGVLTENNTWSVPAEMTPVGPLVQP
jgi:uncharacterized protein (DUF1919 family)